jgi:hypothetical protein
MAAEEWLDAPVVAYFYREFGSPREAAVEAMQLPAFKDGFASLGVRLEIAPDGRPYPDLRTRSIEKPFWKLVEAAVGPGSQGLEAKGEPGRPGIKITQAMLFDLFRAGLERARSTKKRRHPTYAAIAEEHGLRRTWTTPFVKWAETHQREAREAIATSKTPRRFSTLIRD